MNNENRNWPAFSLDKTDGGINSMDQGTTMTNVKSEEDRIRIAELSQEWYRTVVAPKMIENNQYIPVNKAVDAFRAQWVQGKDLNDISVDFGN